MLAALLSALLSLAPAPGQDTAVDDAAARAETEVAEARQAAAQGDYAEAVEHFERALQLRPSAALHYNIAVCHHRLMLEMPEDSAAHEEARRAAVNAYNRYLEAAPDAPDEQAVAQTVFNLGGRPKTLDEWSIEEDPGPGAETPPELRKADPWEDATAPEPDPVEEDQPAAGDDQTTEPTPTPLPDPAPRSTGDQEWLDFPKGRVGVGFYVGISNISRLSDAPSVESIPMLGGVIRGGGFIGRHRQVNLGAELGVHGQPTSTDTRHYLTGGYLALTTEYAHRVGRRQRIEVGGGGLVGLVREVLRHREQTTLTCPRRSTGAVSDRGGLLLGGRFVLNLLLGKDRRHELSLRITPNLGLYAAGTQGSGASEDPMRPAESPCDGDLDGFQELGLDGPALVMTVDLGYAPRF